MSRIESKKLSVLWRLLGLRLVKLQTDQGMRARRNALRALSAVLRRMRERVIEEYPPPPRKPKKVKRRAPRECNEWGATTHVGSGLASKLQAAGIKLTVRANGMSAPAWAAALIDKFPASKVRQAKRSVATRRALLAELALRVDAMANGERW